MRLVSFNYLSQRVRNPFCHINVNKTVEIKISNIWRHPRKFAFVTRLHRTVPLHSFFPEVSSVIYIQIMPGITNRSHIKIQISILVQVSPDSTIGEGTGSNIYVFGNVSECSVPYNIRKRITGETRMDTPKSGWTSYDNYQIQ